MNVLAKVNKSPYGRLSIMKPHDAYSITIHVYTVTQAVISQKQKEVKYRHQTNITMRKIRP